MRGKRLSNRGRGARGHDGQQEEDDISSEKIKGGNRNAIKSNPRTEEANERVEGAVELVSKGDVNGESIT